MDLELRKKLVKCYIWSVALYGAETGTVWRVDQKELESEWYQKTNKTEDTNELTLLAFKIIAILHNTLLATFIKFLETLCKGLFRNRSQNRCHTVLTRRHVCKTCAIHYARQAGKQKEVHPPYSPDFAPAGASSGEYDGLLSFSPPEEHHERRTFFRHTTYVCSLSRYCIYLWL
jgi:hypothetical protein